MEIKRVRSKVVMLPTENKSDIVFIPLRDKIHHISSWTDGKNYDFRKDDSNSKYQHLYFTTEEKIKKGDWYIDDCNLVRKSVTSDKDYWDGRPNEVSVDATIFL